MIKYLLSLFIFLWSGYSQLSAHSLKTRHISFAVIKSVNVDEEAFSDLTEDEDLIFRAASAAPDKEFFKILATENEVKELDEDDAVSLKIQLVHTHYTCDLFLIFPEIILLSNENTQPNHGYVSCTSNSRYLVFQVFRI